MESTNLGTHHATGISMDKIVPTAPTHLSGEPVLATANDTCSAPSGDLFEEVRQLLLLNQTEHLAQPRTEECRLTVDTDTKHYETKRKAEEPTANRKVFVCSFGTGTPPFKRSCISSHSRRFTAKKLLGGKVRQKCLVRAST